MTLPRLKLLLCVLLGVILGLAGGDIIGPLQAQRTTRILPLNPMELPLVYQGSDVGFRVHSHGTTGPRGRMVVRVNGEWQEVHFLPADAP